VRAGKHGRSLARVAITTCGSSPHLRLGRVRIAIRLRARRVVAETAARPTDTASSRLVSEVL
jgi:hypothetical protein